MKQEIPGPDGRMISVPVGHHYIEKARASKRGQVTEEEFKILKDMRVDTSHLRVKRNWAAPLSWQTSEPLTNSAFNTPEKTSQLRVRCKCRALTGFRRP